MERGSEDALPIPVECRAQNDTLMPSPSQAPPLRWLPREPSLWDLAREGTPLYRSATGHAGTGEAWVA
jgi:hypothetical protein